MPSPGPKINSTLQQILDLSDKMGLFLPNKQKDLQEYSAANQFPAVNRDPVVQEPSLSAQQQKSLSIYNMEQKQQREQRFNNAMGYGLGALSFADHLIPEQKIHNPIIRPLPVYNPDAYGTGSQAIAANGIHIKPSHRGLFTKEAKDHHMGVQEFAHHVLAHRDDYSSAVVKRANFARNFGGHHKEAEMGMMLPGVNGIAGEKKKAAIGTTITGDPEKPYSFVDEFKALSKNKLDNTSPFALVKKASAYTKINPTLLFSSAYVEGMNKNLVDPRPLQSDAYVNATQGYYNDFSNKKRLGTQDKIDSSEYPVDGYATYGLDTFGQRFDEFVKRGYLPESFKDQFVPYTATNEAEKVMTAAFKSNEAALEAKAAYLRATQDDVQSYFKKKNQQLDPEAKDFFTMALYNSKKKSGYGMMDEYMAARDKKAFLEQGKTKYKSIWNNIHQRMELMPLVSEQIEKGMRNGGKMKKSYEYEDGGIIGDPIKKAYNPNLAKSDTAFINWYNKNTIEGRNKIPFSPMLDYDYYSFFRNGDYKSYKGGHFPDTYKKPNHPTFSVESIYSVPENPGGSWIGEKYIPAKNKMENGGMIPYFQEGQAYNLDPETIKQLLQSGYELDFE